VPCAEILQRGLHAPVIQKDAPIPVPFGRLSNSTGAVGDVDTYFYHRVQFLRLCVRSGTSAEIIRGYWAWSSKTVLTIPNGMGAAGGPGEKEVQCPRLASHVTLFRMLAR